MELDWIQFAYMGYHMGAYMDPASMDLVFTTLTNGGVLFAPLLQRLQFLYTRA